jgi:hypothetical protein
VYIHAYPVNLTSENQLFDEKHINVMQQIKQIIYAAEKFTIGNKSWQGCTITAVTLRMAPGATSTLFDGTIELIITK